MKKSLQRFGILLASLVATNCATHRTSDFGLIVRLPASRQCLEIKVMSGKEIFSSPEECDRILSRALFMTSESWKMLKGDIVSNCLNAQCKQISGAADGLFLAIDKALQVTPIK